MVFSLRSTHIVILWSLLALLCYPYTTTTAEPAQNEQDKASEAPEAFVLPRRIGFMGTDHNIWLINEDGTGLNQLTTSGSVFNFTFSPNGDQIAYVQGSDLHMINIDGSNHQQLTTGPVVHGAEIDWNGNRVAFIRDSDAVSYVDVTTPGVVVDIVTGVPFLGYGGHSPALLPTLRWSDCGCWVTFEVYPAYGSAFVAAGGSGYLQYSGWQPSWENGGSNFLYTDNGVYSMDATTGTSTLISNVFADYAVYSPDNNFIAFTDHQLRRMNANGSGQILLSDHWAADPAWSFQGDKIVYTKWVETPQGFFEYDGIFVVDVDGVGRQFLVMGSLPQWQPRIYTALFLPIVTR